MTSGLIVVDKSGNITLVNQAAENLLHIDKKAMLGKSSLAIMRNFALNQDLEHCLKQGKVFVNEVVLSKPERYLQVFIAPIYRSKFISEAVLVFTDITSVRQMENMRSQFVANVSHELRTPLTGIKGFVETLQEGAADDPQTRERFLRIIATETERLSRLIDDILELSKIEASKNDMELKPIKLYQLTQDIIQQVEDQAAKREISIGVDVPNDLTCLASRDGLRQILLNLFTNSIKYSPSQSNIILAAAEEPTSIIVSVKDTGMGIPEEDLPRIFERFYRVDKARSRERGGTGLGLSIVKHLVEGMGGKIWVESEVGKGTTFYFTIPKNRE